MGHIEGFVCGEIRRSARLRNPESTSGHLLRPLIPPMMIANSSLISLLPAPRPRRRRSSVPGLHTTSDWSLPARVSRLRIAAARLLLVGRPSVRPEPGLCSSVTAVLQLQPSDLLRISAEHQCPALDRFVRHAELVLQLHSVLASAGGGVSREEIRVCLPGTE